MTQNQREIDLYLDKLLDQAESELDRLFLLRLRDIQNQVAAMYRKYSKNGELTFTDINKYNRFQKEMAIIAEKMTMDYRTIIKKMNATLETQYVEDYLRSAYVYEFEAQVPMGFAPPSQEIIKQAITNPIKALTLPAIFEQHRNEIVRKINIEIAQGLQAGESYSKVAARLEKVVKFSQKKARTVARTEGGKVRSIARQDSAEHATKHADMTKVWASNLDLEVRTSHRVLDGQEADKDGNFHHKGAKAQGPHLWGIASMDINCRCSIIFKVNGKLPKVRRARNVEDAGYQQKLADRIDKYMEQGMTEKQAEKKAKREIKAPSLVVPYQPYKEWVKTLKG